MKIGILTWHKALNHGAILQAYASQKFLEAHGYKSLLLDYNRELQLNMSKRKLFLKRAYKVSSGDILYRGVYQRFLRDKEILFRAFAGKYLALGGNCQQEECDCVMVGSDMVFNLEQGYSPFMFGYGLNTKYIFSYAASSGEENLRLANKLGLMKEIQNGLSKFRRLSSRDRATTEFIRSISGRNDVVNSIDPVLLYGFDNEKKLWNTGKWHNHKKYILIYSYQGNMNKTTEIKAIRDFAKLKGLLVISVGNYHHWCDENINASPDEFLEMFAEADMIITDTFHGTVFSLICQKRFCAIVRGNGFKLHDLLMKCGLESRIARKPNEIPKILDECISYDPIQVWLRQERELAEQYIFCALEEAAK